MKFCIQCLLMTPSAWLLSLVHDRFSTNSVCPWSRLKHPNWHKMKVPPLSGFSLTFSMIYIHIFGQLQYGGRVMKLCWNNPLCLGGNQKNITTQGECLLNPFHHMLYEIGKTTLQNSDFIKIWNVIQIWISFQNESVRLESDLNCWAMLFLKEVSTTSDLNQSFIVRALKSLDLGGCI